VAYIMPGAVNTTRPGGKAWNIGKMGEREKFPKQGKGVLVQLL